MAFEVLRLESWFVLLRNYLPRRVDSSAITVLRVFRVWTEKGRETQDRLTGQSRRSTKRQNGRFRHLALRDCFATSR